MALILHDSELWLLRLLAAGNEMIDEQMMQYRKKHRPDLTREAIRAAREKLVRHRLAAIEGDTYVVTEDGKKFLKHLDT